MKSTSALSFYLATILFIIYLFSTQWSVSAFFIGNESLRTVFLVVSNTAWILSLVMVVFRIVSSFGFYSRNRLFLVLTLILIGLLIFVSKSPAVVLPLLIGFAGIHASNRMLAKTITISIASLLLISYGFSLMGLNGGDVESKPLFGADGSDSSIATALGLSNPNIAMLLYANVIVLFLYLCKTRFQYTLAAIILFLIMLIMGGATGSTTGVIISTVSIILMFGYKYIVGYVTSISYFVRRITPYMFIVVTLLSLLVAMTYTPGVQSGINDALTNRPYFWNLRTENGSFINIYGNNDEYEVDPESREDNQANHYPLDNEPIYILVHYGIIMYLLFAYIFFSGSKRLRDSELLVYVLIACLTIFAGKIIFFGFVYIFLVKALTDYHVLKIGKNMNRKRGALNE